MVRWKQWEIGKYSNRQPEDLKPRFSHSIQCMTKEIHHSLEREKSTKENKIIHHNHLRLVHDVREKIQQVYSHRDSFVRELHARTTAVVVVMLVNIDLDGI